MRPGLGQLATCLLAVLVTTAIVVFYSDNPARVGELPLLVRALLLNLGIASALVGLYFLNPLMRGRPWIYASVVLAPAMVPVFVYFLLLLPRQAGTGITVGELDLSLITDRSSNGIVKTP